MSRGNVQTELRQGLPFPRPSTTPVKVINIDNALYGKGCIFGYVDGAPGTYAATAGEFSKGAIIIDTSNGKPYSNQNAISASPSWTVLS